MAQQANDESRSPLQVRKPIFIEPPTFAVMAKISKFNDIMIRYARSNSMFFETGKILAIHAKVQLHRDGKPYVTFIIYCHDDFRNILECYSSYLSFNGYKTRFQHVDKKLDDVMLFSLFTSIGVLNPGLFISCSSLTVWATPIETEDPLRTEHDITCIFNNFYHITSYLYTCYRYFLESETFNIKIQEYRPVHIGPILYSQPVN